MLFHPGLQCYQEERTYPLVHLDLEFVREQNQYQYRNAEIHWYRNLRSLMNQYDAKVHGQDIDGAIFAPLYLEGS